MADRLRADFLGFVQNERSHICSKESLTVGKNGSIHCPSTAIKSSKDGDIVAEQGIANRLRSFA